MERTEVLGKNATVYVHESMVIERGSGMEGWKSGHVRILGGFEVTLALSPDEVSVDDPCLAPIELRV